MAENRSFCVYIGFSPALHSCKSAKGESSNSTSCWPLASLASRWQACRVTEKLGERLARPRAARAQQCNELEATCDWPPLAAGRCWTLEGRNLEIYNPNLAAECGRRAGMRQPGVFSGPVSGQLGGGPALAVGRPACRPLAGRRRRKL